MGSIDKLAVIVLAAGKGERAGGDRPKQFRTIAGRTVLGHAVGSLHAALPNAAVVVVVPPGAEHMAGEAIGDTRNAIVIGGATRRQSVANALHHLRDDPPSHVLVHDSARPFVQATVVRALVAALEAGADGAVPVLPVADTLMRGMDGLAGDVVARDDLYRVQTPQAFRYDLLASAHADWPMDRIATDDAQMLRAVGATTVLVPGDQRLDKITTADDFARIAALSGHGAETRTGMGYDVHRLEPGRALWLCGVQIPHDAGLAGHSDADVAIHAAVDAILGALGDGDIGRHFPPSDEQWRGAPSNRFLAFAGERVAARQGRIVHLDVTIICEAPKIGPHRDAMRARLAEILAVDADRISVKATTTEGLGFTGRREGIAAQAIATIMIGE